MQSFKIFLRESHDFLQSYQDMVRDNDIPQLTDYLQDNGYENIGKYLYNFLKSPKNFVLNNQSFIDPAVCREFASFNFSELKLKILEIAVKQFLPQSFGKIPIQYLFNKDIVLVTTQFIDREAKLKRGLKFSFNYTDSQIKITNVSAQIENKTWARYYLNDIENSPAGDIIKYIEDSLEPYFKFCSKLNCV